MRSRISKAAKFVLAGAVCVAFCTANASADIVTFWKTDTCPDFAGRKMAIASQLGVMQGLIGNFEPSRPYCRGSVCHGGLLHGDVCVGDNDCPPDSLTKAANGIGGPFCFLLFPEGAATAGQSKVSTIYNADVVVQAGDLPASVNAGEIWNCVVCQYEDKINIPAISTLGTIILMAGLLTAAAYRIGKQQRREVAA